MPRRAGFMVALCAGAIGAQAVSSNAFTWEQLHRLDLQVTSGSITPQSGSAGGSTDPNLYTESAGMRAVERDGGRHARNARLQFLYKGKSPTTVPLASGQVWRQIGLKVRAKDPCNLLYVMWRELPDSLIAISVKRNPGQDTSAECGAGGYRKIADIPVPRAPLAQRRFLEVRTQRVGSLLMLRVIANRSTVYAKSLDPSLAGGLEGPIGVRSDNGRFSFRLSVADRRPEGR